MTLTVDVADHIATITLNRPERLNAFNVEMMRDFIAALDRTDTDDEVRAVIVTGTVIAVVGFVRNSFVRVDFQAAPTVTSFDGGVLALPVSSDGTYVQGPITPEIANHVITVGGIELSNTAGLSRYQAIAKDGYYAVIINTVNEAAATAALNALLSGDLIGKQIQIVIRDTTP